MGILGLIEKARKAGLKLEIAGEKLRITGPRSAQSLVSALHDRKPEVVAALREISESDTCLRLRNPQKPPQLGGSVDNTDGFSLVLDPTHPLASFDWDSANGYCPGSPIVRHGIEHKRESCTSRDSWVHVWGRRYCRRCWPCTDPLAMVIEGTELNEDRT